MDLVRQAREAAEVQLGSGVARGQMAEEHRAAAGPLRGASCASTTAGSPASGRGLSPAARGRRSPCLDGGPRGAALRPGCAHSSAALAARQRRPRAGEPPPGEGCSRRTRRSPQLPPLPPARLRPGARGADQADRVADALLHLYDLVPNVGRLYPQAGQELWRAVSDVEPLLRGQVERLASLDRIEWEMPGSRAAEAAVAAGRGSPVACRAGADALEELIAAAARMLAAPDIGDGVPDALAPAIDSLDAFAHGLARGERGSAGWT